MQTVTTIMLVSSDVNVTDRFTKCLNSKCFWPFVSEFLDVNKGYVYEPSQNFLKRDVKGTVVQDQPHSNVRDLFKKIIVRKTVLFLVCAVAVHIVPDNFSCRHEKLSSVPETSNKILTTLENNSKILVNPLTVRS